MLKCVFEALCHGCNPKMPTLLIHWNATRLRALDRDHPQPNEQILEALVLLGGQLLSDRSISFPDWINLNQVCTRLQEIVPWAFGDSRDQSVAQVTVLGGDSMDFFFLN